MIGLFLKAGKAQVLAVVLVLIAITLFADWAVSQASLGLLYILPMMVGATVLLPWQTAVLAALCSGLRTIFDRPHPEFLEQLLRFVFAFAAYTGLGLFVTALIRNHELAVKHLADVRREQELRREAEEQLKVLAESSPAAILTIDGEGTVLAANRAADSLFSIPRDQSLRGRRIGAYLPVLADALQYQSGPQGLRTTAQCQGCRENGEVFLAHTWFSSYSTLEGPRLAAIVVDYSEEMRDREEQGLNQLIQGNWIAAAAVSHEVRNLCSAISLVCSNLSEKPRHESEEDLQALVNLVDGLQRIASVNLRGHAANRAEPITLQAVLDDLRIVIEPDWREIDATIHWVPLTPMPIVMAEHHGLLQVFLNLAQNSYRAVLHQIIRELSISVSVEADAARIRFRDTGPGITAPEHLFEPFRSGSEGTGLGLYISRALVRSYGGELRYEPQTTGSCFTVEVQIA